MSAKLYMYVLNTLYYIEKGGGSLVQGDSKVCSMQPMETDMFCK